MDEKKRIKKIISLLKKEYPTAKYYLPFHTPLDLLVTAILSAQVRDEVVNATTKKLFQKYKTAHDYARANLQDLINDIKSISYPRSKAKKIIESSKIINEKYKGKIPKTIDELVTLPGIGRKTANVILVNAYGIIEGIACDTHCIRLSQRLGLSTNRNSDKIEKDLMAYVPQEEWAQLPHLLKDHGKAVCKAPTPSCSRCKLITLCPRNGVKKYS